VLNPVLIEITLNELMQMIIELTVIIIPESVINHECVASIAAIEFMLHIGPYTAL